MISFHPLTYLCLTISTILTSQNVFLNCAAQQQRTCPFEYIYQFGASISDTGNYIRLNALTGISAAARPPYGETFFGKPTGRYSDGKLIIDYVADAMGLPLLNPSLLKDASFNHGANFAVGGGTALEPAFLLGKGVLTPPMTIPLRTQLDWFQYFLNATCPDCRENLGKAIVFMGEIGRNDFNYAVGQGKSVEFVKSYVPDIIQSIADAVREVIHAGATHVLVPGSFPTGCFPLALTLLPTTQPGAYDEFGCLRSVNEFVEFQNNHLQEALDSLRQEFPEAVILYVDYYSSFLSVLRNAPSLGFDGQTLMSSCCGTGGKYSFTLVRMCGSLFVPVCSNPNRYLHWDGVHLTQEAYHQISNLLIPDLLRKIGCDG